MAKLRQHIDRGRSSDCTPLRIDVLEALRAVHPDLEFDVKNIKHRDDSFAFLVKARIRGAPVTLETIAEIKHLRIDRPVGNHQVVGYRPGAAKPYVLRDATGDEYEAGAAYVEKVFSRKLGA
jgi:hypothetical protein